MKEEVIMEMDKIGKVTNRYVANRYPVVAAVVNHSGQDRFLIPGFSDANAYFSVERTWFINPDMLDEFPRIEGHNYNAKCYSEKTKTKIEENCRWFGLEDFEYIEGLSNDRLEKQLPLIEEEDILTMPEELK
jgi:hypothetical protein